MKLVPSKSPSKSEAAATPPVQLTEDAAAEVMWQFYREHKHNLIADIKEYRAGILAAVMAGKAVEQVFAPYFKPAEPVKSKRPAA